MADYAVGPASEKSSSWYPIVDRDDPSGCSGRLARAQTKEHAERIARLLNMEGEEVPRKLLEMILANGRIVLHTVGIVAEDDTDLFQFQHFETLLNQLEQLLNH